MNIIKKVSDITEMDLVDYLRINEVTQSELDTLTNLLGVAKAYVTSYTGQSIEALDGLQDVIIAVMILVQDMWDNRTLYVDKSDVNKVVESILGLHSVNLL